MPSEPTTRDLSAVIETALAMGREHFNLELDPTAVEGVVRELLWGERETWRSAEMGILTLTEAATLVVAHLESRLIRRPIQSDFGWDVVGARLRHQIMHVLPRLGPRALSIELVKLPALSPPRLAVRDYDPELDSILSILDDVCDLLQETGYVEFTFRVGTRYLPVDVRTELCILLLQLPAALAAIAERRDFVIDMYEQGVETTLTFSMRDGEYDMTVFSAAHDGLDGGSIAVDDLREMLLRVRARFRAVLAEVAPELVEHPWIRAWDPLS